MEAVISSEILVSTYQPAPCHNQQSVQHELLLSDRLTIKFGFKSNQLRMKLKHYNGELKNLYFSRNIIWLIELSTRMCGCNMQGGRCLKHIKHTP
jgi:hypothetical protein